MTIPLTPMMGGEKDGLRMKTAHYTEISRQGHYELLQNISSGITKVV